VWLSRLTPSQPAEKTTKQQCGVFRRQKAYRSREPKGKSHSVQGVTLEAGETPGDYSN